MSIVAAPAMAASFRRRKVIPLGIALCLLFVLIVIGAAVLGPHLIGNDASALNPLSQGGSPSAAHWLGTDDLGRDVRPAFVAGSGAALIGPAVIAVSGLVVSALIGIPAGYLGGVVDTVTMRVVDFMFALPALLLTIVIVTVVEGGYWVAVLVIALFNVQGDLRFAQGPRWSSDRWLMSKPGRWPVFRRPASCTGTSLATSCPSCWLTLPSTSPAPSSPSPAWPSSASVPRPAPRIGGRC